MSFFMVVLKIFPYLWPFIKEMLIGKKTWKQAYRDHRGKTLMAVFILVLLAYSTAVSIKLGALAVNYLELSRAKQELERKALLCEKAKGPDSSIKHPIVDNKEVQAEIKKPASPHTKAEEHSELDEIKADLERLRQKEAVERH